LAFWAGLELLCTAHSSQFAVTRRAAALFFLL
jgi:hypothetical protein